MQQSGQTGGSGSFGFGAALAAASARAYAVSELLMAGVTPETAGRKPTGVIKGERGVIDTNHPTFVYGHLSLYCPRIWALQGKEPPAGVAPPAPWTDLFKAGAPCLDDVEGKVYPTWAEVSEQYKRGHRAMLEELPKLPDSFFQMETPDPKVRERFPTVASLSMFLFVGHVALHMGQVSAWRRCFGLGSAM